MALTAARRRVGGAASAARLAGEAVEVAVERRQLVRRHHRLVVRRGDVGQRGQRERLEEGLERRHRLGEDAVAVRGDALELVLRPDRPLHLERRREVGRRLDVPREGLAALAAHVELIGGVERLPLLGVDEGGDGGVVVGVVRVGLGVAGRLGRRVQVDAVVEVAQPEDVIELRRRVEPPRAERALRLPKDLLAVLIALGELGGVGGEVARNEGERGRADIQPHHQPPLVPHHAPHARRRHGRLHVRPMHARLPLSNERFA